MRDGSSNKDARRVVNVFEGVRRISCVRSGVKTIDRIGRAGPYVLVAAWMAVAASWLWPGVQKVRDGGWHQYHEWAYSHLAYSDILALYVGRHLASHAVPYVHQRIEYPVVTGVFMWTMAWLPGTGGYFIGTAVALFSSAASIVWVLEKSNLKLAWLFAASPLLLVYSLLNWDLLSIALMLIAWHSWRRRRMEVAGVLFALGIFSKWFPIVLLVYCLVATWTSRRDRDVRVEASRMGFTALATSFVVNIAFVVVNVRGWGDFFSFNALRTSNSGLFYEMSFLAKVATPSIGWVDLSEGVLICAIGIILVTRVRRGMGAELAASVAFAGFLIVNKDFSPQYMLWLMVFALIANWPAWTIAILSVVGLIDYANAIASLNWSYVSLNAFRWYASTVDPSEVAMRDIFISLATAVALFGSNKQTSRSTSRDTLDIGLQEQVVRSAEEIVGRAPDDLIRN